MMLSKRDNSKTNKTNRYVITINNNGLKQRFTEERISLKHKTVTMACVDRRCKCAVKLQLDANDFDIKIKERSNVSI